MKRKLTVCWYTTKPCGCGSKREFGLRGVQFEPIWSLCPEHLRERFGLIREERGAS